jgi:hypothetical protein
MANSDQEILNKVSNLLNKTVANGCSVAESESAAKAAQYLLTKYRLSISDITDSEAVIDYKHDDTFNNVVLWKSGLIKGIAEVNGCAVVIWCGTNKHFKLIGKKTNIDAAVELFDRLVESVEYHCRKNQKKGAGKSWANSFKLGFVVRIVERLKEGFEEAKKECSETAIVKLNSDLIEANNWLAKNMATVKPKTYKDSVSDNAAYYKGYAVGNSANLNNKLIED